MTTVVVVKKAGQIAIAADTLVTFGDTMLSKRYEDNTKIFRVETDDGPRFVRLHAAARGIAPGQTVVVYDDDRVVGSATIQRAVSSAACA